MGNFVHEVGNLTCSALETASGSLFCVSSSDVTAVGIGVSSALVIAIYVVLSGSLLRG